MCYFFVVHITHTRYIQLSLIDLCIQHVSTICNWWLIWPTNSSVYGLISFCKYLGQWLKQFKIYLSRSYSIYRYEVCFYQNFFLLETCNAIFNQTRILEFRNPTMLIHFSEIVSHCFFLSNSYVEIESTSSDTSIRRHFFSNERLDHL